MIFVPTGYGLGADLYDVETLRGGNPYGAGTYAGPTGARQVRRNPWLPSPPPHPPPGHLS